MLSKRPCLFYKDLSQYLKVMLRTQKLLSVEV